MIHLLSISSDRLEDQAVSDAVIRAVADAEAISPLEVHPPLATVLDPDALDTLFQSDGMNGELEFTYLGYEITVRADGRVALDSDNE